MNLLLKIKQLFMNCQNPLIVICGGTGTGKSKLGIELAKQFNGEIINADSIQVYKGLDIATNKVTTEECQGIPHHLLGYIEPKVIDYCVHDFQTSAVKCIEDLKSKSKIPILVGGTNYYIESVLWEKLIPVQNYDQEDALLKLHANHQLNSATSMSNIELYDWLKELDSQSAFLLHPNDRRKVWRALEISLNSNMTRHDHLLATNTMKRRFKLNNTIVFWLYSDADKLEPRLDVRIDEMMKNGLLSELHEIQDLFLQLRPNKKYTKGIFQAIGFKEFENYLNFEDKSDDSVRQTIDYCVNRLKIAHKRYVRTQNKWIKNRFLLSDPDTSYPIFRLDVSDVNNWRENVLERSLEIIKYYQENLNSTQQTDNFIDFVDNMSIKPNNRSDIEAKSNVPCYKICQICDNRVFVNEEQWYNHIKSNKHHKRVKGLTKKEKNKLKIEKNL